MKRIGILLTFIVLSISLFAPLSASKTRKKKATAKKSEVPCPTALNDINDCLETGCGPSLDPNLNKQKNIRSLDGEAEPMTIQEIRNLPDPVSGLQRGLEPHCYRMLRGRATTCRAREEELPLRARRLPREDSDGKLQVLIWEGRHSRRLFRPIRFVLAPRNRTSWRYTHKTKAV